MSVKNLEKIFDPKIIAVIGASSRPKSVGYVIFKNLICSDYDGIVFPVNPKHKSVQGIQAFASVDDVPYTPDLAIIAIPAKGVPETIRQCGERGTQGVIIISAGFAEMGEEGKSALQAIEQHRDTFGMRIMGPNCMGIIRPQLSLNASFALSNVAPGPVAFISQSGALGSAILDWAAARNIGLSHFVSLGSMMDVDFGDLIDYFGSDPQTGSIILYIESLSDPRRFMSAARGFAMNKPIIIVKSGRVAEGAKAAASHTGAMAGEDAVYDAVMRRAGVVRVNKIVDLFHASETLSMQPLPAGNRLCIITNAGGPGVMAVDTLVSCGGALAELKDETKRKLNEVLPEFWSRANPVDVLGDAGADRYARTLEICLEQDNIDGALIILTPQAMTEPEETARYVVEAAAKFDKPVISSWLGADLVEASRGILRQGSVPCYTTPEESVEIFMTMYRYRQNIIALYETPENIDEEQQPQVDEIRTQLREIAAQGRTTLSERESKGILQHYGVPTTMPRLAESAHQAEELAEQTGFPVVMKIQSADISHKSDAGGVLLDIADAHQAAEAFDKIVKNARAYNEQARIDGVTVQKMIKGDQFEIIIGSKRDPVFGSVILFGAGGVTTEIFKDSAIGLPPINQTLCHRFMENTRIYRLLKDGHRNRKPANMRKLESLLISFSQMLVDLPELREIDLNPVLVDEHDSMVVDARMLLDIDTIQSQSRSPNHLLLSPYPRHLIKQITVSGQEITLRPIKPEDEPLWIDMFNSFSNETKRFRFFHAISDISHQERIRFTFSDFTREIAIVPVVNENGSEKILGVGRMQATNREDTADIAFALRDEWQSRGLGEALYDYLSKIARERGIKKLHAQALAGNTKMINLFRKKGCDLQRLPDEGLYSVTCVLPEIGD
ncbi:MAG: GNAT family N-acetyltransferase [Chitinivibrionales bacterium]|nr:GNAT family N-acetyltransferase [Chitinivibrionales bacterium]